MSTARKVHLWADGTWDELGGNSVALRVEEYEEMRDVIASARSIERCLRLGYSPDKVATRLTLLQKRLRSHDEGLALGNYAPI
jgi:hypothetical protein